MPSRRPLTVALISVTLVLVSIWSAAPSGQAARSIDALDLYTRAKASGMRGFVIKGHLDQTAGLAYYMRKLHPDFEIFGGMGSKP